MVYPPTLPPTTRTDSTIAAGNHASDHNELAGALAAIVEMLGADPAGPFADLGTRILGITTDVSNLTPTNGARAVGQGELVINIGDYLDEADPEQAAFDDAVFGATIIYPRNTTWTRTTPITLTCNGLTIVSVGATLRMTVWGVPYFDALRQNFAGNWHRFRLGDVTYTGVRGNHLGSNGRGGATYTSGCVIYCNGDHNFVESLHAKDFPTPIYFSSWDGTSAVDRTGIGNGIGTSVELEGYDFGLLYVKQSAFNWGSVYAHDDHDDSGGANPTHAIYCSAATGQRAGSGLIGQWQVVNNLGGHAFLFKFQNGLTFTTLKAENCKGLAQFQSCDDLKGTSLHGTSLTSSGSDRQVGFVGTEVCTRVNIDSIFLTQAAGNDSFPVNLWAIDSNFGSIDVRSNHSASVNVALGDVLIRGYDSTVRQIMVKPLGTPIQAVHLGTSVESDKAYRWHLNAVRAIGTTTDNIPVTVFNHSHSNVWSDGFNALIGATPTSGVYRRGLSWLASAPSVGSPKGWTVQTAGGFSAQVWAATTTVTAGAWWRTSGGKVLRYITGGTTGSSEPAPTTIGATASDGTATYEYMVGNAGAVTSIGNL